MMFVTEFHGSDGARLTAAADAVFAALVDIDRLPEWNARIHHVIETPCQPGSRGHRVGRADAGIRPALA